MTITPTTARGARRGAADPDYAGDIGLVPEKWLGYWIPLDTPKIPKWLFFEAESDHDQGEFGSLVSCKPT